MTLDQFFLLLIILAMSYGLRLLHALVLNVDRVRTLLEEAKSQQQDH